MSNNTLDSLNNRFSADIFTENTPITDNEIMELIGYAKQAPTSYNLQNWHFVAVRDTAKKQALRAAAYDQEKITSSSVAFVICGDLNGTQAMERVFTPLLNAGFINKETYDYVWGSVNGKFTTQPQAARDEAVRSASLGAMCLMLAGEAKGYISCPMSGFEPQKVSEVCNLPDNLVPVMIVVLGKGPSKDKKPRLATNDILTII